MSTSLFDRTLKATVIILMIAVFVWSLLVEGYVGRVDDNDVPREAPALVVPDSPVAEASSPTG